jgi:hypothetical protein
MDPNAYPITKICGHRSNLIRVILGYELRDITPLPAQPQNAIKAIVLFLSCHYRTFLECEGAKCQVAVEVSLGGYIGGLRDGLVSSYRRDTKIFDH